MTTNTQTIARNTGWFSIENALNALVALITSIAINRYLGPDKNSYIIFVSQVAAMVSGLGGFGIPATTKKYMAEFIGMGDRGTARFIYWRTLAIQTALATLAAGSLLIWVLKTATGDYKLASALLVLSIWPAMINSISAQANTATEDLSTNLPGSVAAALTYLVAIAAMVVLHWGVVGVGVALLCMRSVDFLVRFFPAMKRVLEWKTTHLHPPGLVRRMFPFAWQNLVSTAVAMVVWGRSEVLLLEYLNSDKNQVSFYSVAFTMAEQLLLVAIIFGSAAGTTIFVQYGRDKSKLPELAASAFRYIALMSIPLHFIAASLAVPLLLLFYGHKFQGAAMVVALAPLLCMFKAFLAPAQNLLESSERQRYVIAATVFAGIIDISVAWYLIPAHGAVGACIGNGAAQLTAVGILWAIVIYHFKVKLPWLQVAKIVLISALAALTAHLIALRLPPVPAILCGGCAALIVLFGLFYLMRVLEREDHDRLGVLAGMLPRPVTWLMDNLLWLLTRQDVAKESPTAFFNDNAIPAESSMLTEAQRQAQVQCAPPSMDGKFRGDQGIKISVVIPAYNAARFLPRCLESIFAQTLKPAEIIVVDDGSTDNSAALAAELGARVVRRPNGGISAARNMGIQNASSEWIALLDADDLWAPEKLERQAALIRPETVLVYTGIRFFDDKGIRDERLAIDPILANKMLRYCNPIPCTYIIRREALIQGGGFREDIRTCEDWEMLVRLRRLGKFEAVADPLTDVYLHSDSLSANPELMLQGFERLLDTTLLVDLQGFERWAWRHRIWAEQFRCAAMIARENKLKGELYYLYCSLRAWPSPFWRPRRFAEFEVSVRNRLRRWVGV
jgi:glycosyltransferase involved in cell wall biosynthesis/O-antigen/teichoic acid export membrane protein